MAFCFVSPEEFEYLEQDGEFSVVGYVGADPDTGGSYSVVTTLSPYGDHVEYSFSVIELLNDDERSISRGLETKTIFPEKADRAAILEAILEATERLLNWKQPALVERCTMDVVQNGAMLEKHHFVSQVFNNCGYEVTDCGDWNGQLIWQAKRIAGEEPAE